MSAISQPLSNLQLELLKAFSHRLSDQDLLELKKVLAAFFAERAIKEADQVWEEENWDQAKVEELLQAKLRTPYSGK